MGKFETFRAMLLKEMNNYAVKNELSIQTNNGISELKPFNDNDLDDDMVLYWLCKEKKTLAYLRFTKHSDEIFYVVIDNKSISLMLDGELKRLTSYPSQHFNNTVDSIIQESKSISRVLDYMMNIDVALYKMFRP